MLSSDRVVRTTCPYCGVGCQMDLNIKDDYIYRVDAPFDAAPNYGMLCVKGRFGTDYVKHPGRVKTPLIRVNREEGRSVPNLCGVRPVGMKLWTMWPTNWYASATAMAEMPSPAMPVPKPPMRTITSSKS